MHLTQVQCKMRAFDSMRKQLTFWDATTGFSQKMMSEKQVKKIFDLGSNVSSVKNFCSRFSDVILGGGGDYWWRHRMLAVFFRLSFEQLHCKPNRSWYMAKDG